MKNKKTRIILLTSVVLVLTFGLVAFIPLDEVNLIQQGDEVEPQPGDHQEALAEALDVTVEELQAAYEVAAQKAMEQSINDALEKGLITQERADEMLNNEFGFGRRGHFGRGFGGANIDELVAAELGISLDDFQAAQTQVHTAMIEQAVADGNMTQNMADQALARNAAGSYFQNAWTEAYQNAVQSALGDDAITQGQADLLLDNMNFGGMRGGFPGKMFGGRGGHPRPPVEQAE